jgi:predicted transposase/invertase (TIGR01784 family)
MSIISKTKDPTLIRFDWAMKRLLRHKANYVVLEGFLTVLLEQEVKIISIKESESNKTSPKNKFNRVDILVENTDGEFFIIELQNEEQEDYFLRMLYAVSKTVSEHLYKGEKYYKVRKVYHINIVYFKLGNGLDYVYHGSTVFRGKHLNDVLQLTEDEKEYFAIRNKKDVSEVEDLFPEYYILCVEDFDDNAKDSLDEWIYYFKNNAIPKKHTAPGLKEAREQLTYDKLSERDKRKYDADINNRRNAESTIETALFKQERALKKGRAEGLVEGEAIGLEKGEAIGLEKGRTEGRAESDVNAVLNGHHAGYSIEIIANFTGLTKEQIIEILKQHRLII